MDKGMFFILNMDYKLWFEKNLEVTDSLTSDYFSKVGIWLAKECLGLLFKRMYWESVSCIPQNIAMENLQSDDRNLKLLA